MHEVILPKLGQTMEEGTIVEWLKEEGDPVSEGDVLFRPVFERGASPDALQHIPSETWLDCPDCAEERPTT